MARNKRNNFNHVSKLPILKYSGFSPRFDRIEIAKKHSYCVIKGVAVTGDAPKDIIRYYEYGDGPKKKPQSWPIYIAKLGHKYYPMESITEQLISDVGTWFGFNLASSKICYLGGQIRFLSRYFIESSTDELHHGADIYAGFLHDKQFVDDIEMNRMTQSFFTIKFTKEVLQHFFKDSFNVIFENFMLMLFFDALIGNNDRHMYNWGVIRDIHGEKHARFSPIYDSARGLLWNETETKIRNVLNTANRRETFIQKYCDNSKPKIGIENKENVNHFNLVDYYNAFYHENDFVQNLFGESKLDLVISKINTNYSKLLSPERRSLIKDILNYRYSTLKKIVY